MEAGDLLVLNQLTRHAIRAAGREDIGVNFIILPEFFDAAFGLLERDGVLDGFHGQLSAPERRQREVPALQVAGVLLFKTSLRICSPPSLPAKG